jgi:hypothetical protein
VALGRVFSFLIYTQSVGLLGRRISPLQGRCLHTEQYKHTINAHRHPCLEWNPNSGPQCSSGEDDSCLRPRGHCDRRRTELHTPDITQLDFQLSTLATKQLPQTVPVITSRHGPHRKHRSSFPAPFLLSYLLLWERVYQPVT